MGYRSPIRCVLGRSRAEHATWGGWAFNPCLAWLSSVSGARKRPKRFGQASDPVVDLLGCDSRVGKAQRVLATVEQEVGPLHKRNSQLAGKAEQSADVGPLG